MQPLTSAFIDLLTYLRGIKHPVIAPFRSSIYSDNGFALLTVILERITCRPYREAIIHVLGEPLGLTHLTATPPNGTDIDAIDRSRVDEGSAWGINVPIFAGQVFLNAPCRYV
jgi:CubicO group peptidase (beta-lactamase class C family)